MRRALQIALIVAAGLALGGCDKCGDWFWQSNSEAPHVCRGGSGPSGL